MADHERSPARQEASRKNGSASRGPRSSEGKARSSGNATAHGLRAERVLLRHEDPDLNRQHVEKWVAALQPEGETELEVAIAIADVRWKLMRLDTIEANRLRGDEDLRPLLQAVRDVVAMVRRVEDEVPELFLGAAGLLDAVPVPLGQSLGRTPAALGSKQLPHQYKCRSRPVSRVLSPRGPRDPRGGRHSSPTCVAARL